MLLFVFVTIFAVACAKRSPVPYSKSAEDGMPTEQDWELFESLHEQACSESEMREQRTQLLNYAAARVRESLSEIRDNLKTLKVEGFDMVWPGNGFAGVAYGGLREVVLELEKAGVSRAGKLMGVSGGAASTILTLAGSDAFLKFYQVYQSYYEGHPKRLAAETMRDTGLTSAIYAEAMRNATAFSQAQHNALIVSRCSTGGNTIFRAFETLKQLVAAGYSSGDASIGGELIGTRVDNTHVGHCADGGSVTVFPAEVASVNFGVLKYNTPWISMQYPTSDSIHRLFRAGVDNAIEALKSSHLTAEVDDGSIVGVLPGPNGIVTATEYSDKIGTVEPAQDINLSAAVSAAPLIL